jgi:aryl-alcohol dehydrogenase-like predicted oxidoreductase/spore coat polysaccharide biosynthesis protein SpsF (cytidylyltransferase family)
MKILVILQARAASARLPGKALLPVAGYPCAALAALRAANQGHRVIVATSTDASDDLLAQTLQSHKIEVFRGPLDDVLSRYYQASADLPSGSIVVRLTGDNVAPDGGFIAKLAAALAGSGSEYMNAGATQTALPYGLGGEAFLVDALRKAHSSATSPYDREHVGPWMARNCRAAMYSPDELQGRDYSHLRCTIDDQEDYWRILRLFDGMSNPLTAGWLELMRKLSEFPGEPQFRVPYKLIDNKAHSVMTLGTAQLGLEYGAVNRTGKPSLPAAIKIVRRAIAHGVTALDTARAYGDSEQVLGESLTGAWRSRAQVITKLDPLALLSCDSNEEQVRKAVDRSVSDSCRALCTDRLSVLLLHRWSHHDAWHGAAWKRLLDLRDSGKISKLGASAYEPQEAFAALEDPDVQLLQLPMNILDLRWRASGIAAQLAQRPDIVVHARSIFLQGILLHHWAAWPSAGRYDVQRCAARIQELSRKFGRESVADLCVAYVRAQPWITSLVIGCETITQLEGNLRMFCLPPLTADQCDEIERSFSDVPADFLNPSTWKPVHA